MTLCCKAVVWLGNILRNKNENIQHPWFLSVPEGEWTKINTRDKVFPWLLSAWIIPHVIFFSVSLLWSFWFSHSPLATFSHILIIILNHVVAIHSPHSAHILNSTLILENYVWWELNPSSSSMARLRYNQFVLKSIKLFYHCQFISLSIILLLFSTL